MPSVSSLRLNNSHTARFFTMSNYFERDETLPIFMPTFQRISPALFYATFQARKQNGLNPLSRWFTHSSNFFVAQENVLWTNYPPRGKSFIPFMTITLPFRPSLNLYGLV